LEQQIKLKEYFKEFAPSTEYNKLTVRTINALVRGGIETMDDLCAASVERLTRVRNLGDKCLEMALFMRDKYESEKK
jgi:DNA-directed RNA polymerase alpha subunit